MNNPLLTFVFFLSASAFAQPSPSPSPSASPVAFSPSSVVIPALAQGQGEGPSSPAISADGKRMVYEVAQGKSKSLWIANTDGSEAKSLTGALQSSRKLPPIVEKASWHPKRDFLAFEGRTEKGTPSIYVVRVNEKISEYVKLLECGHPRFSYPSGQTLFCEVADEEKGVNTLRYFQVGDDPLHPRDLKHVPLHGPIQKVGDLEFQHPALSRDGISVVFSAGARLRVQPEGDFKSILEMIGIRGDSRERALEVWPRLVANKKSSWDITESLISISDVFKEIDSPLTPRNLNPVLASRLLNDMKNTELDRTVKGLWGVTRRDLLRFWAYGLLLDRSLKQKEVQGRLGSRIWMTDLFGGPLKAVADFEDAKVPQTHPVVTSDSRHVIFVADSSRGRQLFVADTVNQKVMQLTTKGTENTEPVLSADDQTLYFVSNESGKREIRKATIDWTAMKAAIRKMERTH